MPHLNELPPPMLKENPARKNECRLNNFTVLAALYRHGKTETLHFIT